jgi:MFS family permease
MIVPTPAQPNPRRWWILATMVAAQFIYVVDAFIVNVAIPAIRADIHASSAEIEAVIAIYQIAYAAVVITGGRLGHIHGQKRLFLAGLLGYGQGMVMAPLFGTVLAEVRHDHAGAGSGVLSTVNQAANAAGVALAGAIYFGVAATHPGRPALLASLAFHVACALATIACLARLRPAVRALVQES